MRRRVCALKDSLCGVCSDGLMMIRRSRVGDQPVSEDPKTKWEVQELTPLTGKPGGRSSQQRESLPPLKLNQAPLKPIAEDAVVSASGTPLSAEGSEDVDSDSKGMRFLKNYNSWVSAETESASLTMEDDFTLFSYMEYLSLVTTEDIDFAFLERILENGEDINGRSPTTGRCIMHEVAANWGITVADFFLKKGSEIHQKDKEGKTPLHIAASTDHSEMVEWLIENGAELEPRTDTEKQTPLHHAARYDARQAIEILIDKGSDCEVRDYKGRTPLHLAAELDRTAAAVCLISVPILAEVRVQDDTGNRAITTMIRTMPRVAMLALDQLHRVVPAKRKQYFLLNHLEPEPGSGNTRGLKTPFEIAVEEKRHNILSHPVMQMLIREKWRYVRWFFYGHLSLYFIFLLSWSLLIAFPSVQEKHMYIFPTDAWRIIAEIIAISTYIFQLVEEVFELASSKLKYKHYRQLRTEILQDDLKNLSPHLKEEKEFLEGVIKRLNKNRSNYFRDYWNIIDIIAYAMILLLILLHIVDIAFHTVNIALWVARISCFVLILIWVRLFKHARGFLSLGPLVTIVYKLIGDILRYFTLYAIVFVPYVICFWVLFGGLQSQSLPSTANEDLTTFYRVAIVMFRMSLIDEYPYSSFRAIDEAMAAILVITFMLCLAVVGINLFIALLSDTFQRVYDNAQAIAILQQADLILSYEEKMCGCLITRYRSYIHNKCNPKSTFYDDDDFDADSTKEVKKVVHQIHDIVSALHSDHLNNIERCDVVTECLEEQDSKLEQIRKQLDEIQAVLPEKSKKSRGSPGFPQPQQYGARRQANNIQYPTARRRSKKKQRQFIPQQPSSEPQVTATREALNKISNQRQRNMRQAAASSNMKTVSSIAESRVGQPMTSHFSLPGSPDMAELGSISAQRSSLGSARLQSHNSSEPLTTPPIATGYQQPFFSHQSSNYDSSYYGTRDSAAQMGHRRMRKINRKDLEKMQWEKKSQPAKR